MAVITEIYKGILLNRQGNEAPNGDIETAVLKTLIDRSEYITSIINAGNAGDIAMFTGNPAAALGPSAMNQVNNIVVGDFYDVLRLFTEATVDGFGIQISNAETTQSDGTKLGVTVDGHCLLSSPNQILIDTPTGIINLRGTLSNRTVARITNVSNYNIDLGEETAFIEIGLDANNDEPHIRCAGYDSFYIEDFLSGVVLPKKWFSKSNSAGIRLGYDHTDTDTDPIDILIDGNEIDIVGTALRFNGVDIASAEAITSGSFSATWTGYYSNPTSTVEWVKHGKVVTLNIRAFNAQSNSLSIQSSDWPSTLRPVAGSEISVSMSGIWYDGNSDSYAEKNVIFHIIETGSVTISPVGSSWGNTNHPKGPTTDITVTYMLR